MPTEPECPLSARPLVKMEQSKLPATHTLIVALDYGLAVRTKIEASILVALQIGKLNGSLRLYPHVSSRIMTKTPLVTSYCIGIALILEIMELHTWIMPEAYYHSVDNKVFTFIRLTLLYRGSFN